MDQVQYECKSIPGLTVSVSVKYARKAKEIIRAVLVRPHTVGGKEIAEKNPEYLKDYRIFRAMVELAANTPNKNLDPAMQDRLFLEVCVYESRQGGDEGIGEMARALFTVERNINKDSPVGRPMEEWLEDRPLSREPYVIKDP